MDEKRIIDSWSSQNVVNYYISHRDNADELYPSEKRYLEETLKPGKNILDIGCAAGGFSKIVKSYNKTIDYAGIDISPVMIDKAKKRFPDDKFYVFNDQRIDFADNLFDVVICFGVLHMTEAWEKLFAEAWRVCNGTMLCDLRIVEGEGVCDSTKSYQKLEFSDKWDGIAKAPYVVTNIDEVLKLLVGLTPRISTLKAYGYWHSVSSMTVSNYKEVCMSVFSIRKKGNHDMKVAEWESPVRPKLDRFANIIKVEG